MLNSLLDGVLRYRGFIADSIKRDFQSRYQNSFLGALWLILQPVAIIVVYTVIFAELMHTRFADIHGPFAYSIFLCSGILTWGLFTETLNNLVQVFITYANILKKLSFPRICLPIIIACSTMINFCIIFSLFMIFLIVSGNFPGWIILEMIPVLIIQMTFTLGLGIILGIMNVFIRDIEQFVRILLQFWFWFTPIVYVSKTLPESVRGLLKLNPMTSIISSYQNIFLFHNSPAWWGLLPVAVISLLLIVMGGRMFKKHSADILDEL